MKKNLICFFGMTKKNILVYLKDKTTVFFSMLGPLIVLGLYVLFLKQNYTESINEAVAELGDLISSKDIDAFINSWLIAGILGTSSITVALNSLSVMVSDKQAKIDYDYKATPMKNFIVVMSYFMGAFVCTILITGMVLIVGLVYLALTNTFYLSFINVVELIVSLILGTLSSTIIMMIVCSFFKKNSAMGAFSGIMTAIVGFVIGAYMPISSFSTIVQSGANLVPGSHVAGLFRNQLMLPVLEKISNSLNGVDGGVFLADMKSTFSVSLYMFGYQADKTFMYIYVIGTILLALGINIFLYRFSSKRK